MLAVLRLRMCSNRCAKPERPSGSCLEPTSYHIEVMTLDVVVSRMAITRRPFFRRRSVNLIGGTSGLAFATPGCAVAIVAPEIMTVGSSAALPRRNARIVERPLCDEMGQTSEPPGDRATPVRRMGGLFRQASP